MAGQHGVKRWESLSWEDWDHRTKKTVRPDVREIIEEHRPPHEVQQRMGFFGVEEVRCVTCGRIVWDVDQTAQIDVY